MPLRLGLVALAALFVYRLRSTAQTARSPSSPPVSTRWRKEHLKAGVASRGSLTVAAAAAAIAGAATGATSDDPVSPELALVDSSLRDRLMLDEAASEAQPSTTIPPSTSDPATTAANSRARRSLAFIALLITTAIVAAVGFLLFVAHHEGTPVPAVSTQTPLSPDATAGGATTGRNFAWAPVKAASRYEVEIRRSNDIIYSATTSVPHVTVPARWSQNGRTFVLSPGTYRWYVWPVTVSGAHNRRGAAIVATSFSITR